MFSFATCALIGYSILLVLVHLLYSWPDENDYQCEYRPVEDMQYSVLCVWLRVCVPVFACVSLCECVCIDRGFNVSIPTGVLFASHTCSIMRRLKKKINDTCRLPNQHRMFEQLLILLTTHFTSSQTSQWCPFCEQALGVVYDWAQHPDWFAERLLKNLSNAVFPPNAPKSKL